MTTNHPDAERLAAGLTGGARRACLRMTDLWTFPGKQAFDANGAHALYWARTGHGAGALAERRLFKVRPDKPQTRWGYRLTPLGEEIRTILQSQGDTHG